MDRRFLVDKVSEGGSLGDGISCDEFLRAPASGPEQRQTVRPPPPSSGWMDGQCHSVCLLHMIERETGQVMRLH